MGNKIYLLLKKFLDSETSSIITKLTTSASNLNTTVSTIYNKLANLGVTPSSQSLSAIREKISSISSATKSTDGSLASSSATTVTLTTQGQSVGFHNKSKYSSGDSTSSPLLLTGSQYIKADISNLYAENIKKGVNVGGIVGTSEDIRTPALATNPATLLSYYSTGTTTTTYYPYTISCPYIEEVTLAPSDWIYSSSASTVTINTSDPIIAFYSPLVGWDVSETVYNWYRYDGDNYHSTIKYNTESPSLIIPSLGFYDNRGVIKANGSSSYNRGSDLSNPLGIYTFTYGAWYTISSFPNVEYCMVSPTQIKLRVGFDVASNSAYKYNPNYYFSSRLKYAGSEDPYVTTSRATLLETATSVSYMDTNTQSDALTAFKQMIHSDAMANKGLWLDTFWYIHE